MLTDAKLRNLKYRLGGKNRYRDREGLYAIVNEGGTISFRYDFTDSQSKHQVVTHGRYFSGESTSRARRLAGIEAMILSIYCANQQETDALTAVRKALANARPVFEKTEDRKPAERRERAIPLIALEEARDINRKFRRKLSLGINPVQEAKKAREAAMVATYSMATCTNPYRYRAIKNGG